MCRLISYNKLFPRHCQEKISHRLGRSTGFLFPYERGGNLLELNLTVNRNLALDSLFRVSGVNGAAATVNDRTENYLKIMKS